MAEALKDYGVRVQESVFVAEIEDVLYSRMMERVSAEVGERDRLNVWPLCEACWGKGVKLGSAEMPEDKLFYLI